MAILPAKHQLKFVPYLHMTGHRGKRACCLTLIVIVACFAILLVHETCSFLRASCTAWGLEWNLHEYIALHSLQPDGFS